jgi:predicted CopG family antitoxin
LNKKAKVGREAFADVSREAIDKGRDLFEKGRKMADDAADLFERGRRLVEG